MAYYAKVVTEDSVPGIGSSVAINVVTQVIVAEPDFFDTYIDNEPGRWILTHKGMNGGVLWNPDGTKASDQTGVGTMGYNYAGKGMLYDMDKHAFYCSRPVDAKGKSCDSFTLNTTTYRWDPPIARPDTDVYWDEAAYQADNTKGWTNY